MSTSVSGVPSPVLSDRALPPLNKESKKQVDFDICSFKLEFDDLNECVAALLKKAKDDFSQGRDVKRRQRKNKD